MTEIDPVEAAWKAYLESVATTFDLHSPVVFSAGWAAALAALSTSEATAHCPSCDGWQTDRDTLDGRPSVTECPGAALSTQPETVEWEYGVAVDATAAERGTALLFDGREAAEAWMSVLPMRAEMSLRRRTVARKAGPWLPVPALPEGDGATT